MLNQLIRPTDSIVSINIGTYSHLTDHAKSVQGVLVINGIVHLANAHQSPAELAQRVAHGDTEAASELVRRYEKGLRILLVRRTRDSQLAQDLCQDTFVIALKKLRAGELRKPEALAGFLRQIAVNLSIEHFRKEKRYVRQDDGIIELQTPHIERKAERIDREQVRAILDGALDELAQPRDREILKRFYLLDEDKSSICTALELSAAHFDRVLYRAKQRMRSLIQQRPELKNLLFGSLFDG